jgi:hypothetical protein
MHAAPPGGSIVRQSARIVRHHASRTGVGPLTPHRLRCAAGLRQGSALEGHLAELSEAQGVALLDHLQRTQLRGVPQELLSAAALSGMVSTVGAQYQVCSAARLAARAGRAQRRPSQLQQHLQLPASRPGGAAIAPADLLAEFDGVPGVALCWDGPDELVERLGRMIRAGELGAQLVRHQCCARWQSCRGPRAWRCSSASSQRPPAVVGRA